MKKVNPYCVFAGKQEEGNVHKVYHDTEYGFPLLTDNELFGRLILEINQAGLSWDTILKKKLNFYNAYSHFDIHSIANYDETNKQRLLSNAGIIRNKLKVNAAIYNANVILELKEKFGSFGYWLDSHHPMSRESWVRLFKTTFKFTGGEITNEFLMSTGYLYGTHHESCSIYHEIAKLNPKWMDK